MTRAIVGVLLRTVNPRGGRSIGSGCEMRPPSSRPGRRLWRGSLLLATRHAVRRKAASAPSINLLSAPLPIPLVCGDIHGFRRVSRGGEAMARRQKEERRAGIASRGIIRRLGCCSSRARQMVVVSTFRAPALCRHVHHELLRSALLDMPPIRPTTACHQRNDVERYSRYSRNVVKRQARPLAVAVSSRDARACPHSCITPAIATSVRSRASTPWAGAGTERLPRGTRPASAHGPRPARPRHLSPGQPGHLA